MGKLLDRFLDLADSDGDILSIAELMSPEELDKWELLVKCFTELHVTTVSKDLKRISKFYKLEKWQEISILALVKMMELMIKEAETEGITLDGSNTRTTTLEVKPMDREYDGSMFG
jgi:hypothetical protein